MKAAIESVFDLDLRKFVVHLHQGALHVPKSPHRCDFMATDWESGILESIRRCVWTVMSVVVDASLL